MPGGANEPRTTHEADHWPAYPMRSNDMELDAYPARVKLRPAYVACLEKGGSDHDAAACIRGEHLYQKRRMDQAYRQLATRVDGQRRAQLNDEQERWLRWRDARCAREEFDVAIAGCMVEMEADRATQLEARGPGRVQ